MKLFFTNEDYYYKAMLILNNDCKKSIDRDEAFSLLIKGLPVHDLDNLCIEISKIYNISIMDAYNYLQKDDVNNIIP